MKDNDILLWDETLFKDLSVLEPDYLPEYFPHRETQLNSLKICAQTSPARHASSELFASRPSWDRKDQCGYESVQRS